MDARLLHAVITATESVINSVGQLSVSRGEPGQRDGSTSWGDATGVLELNDGASLVISFDEPSIIDLAGRMLGQEVSAINSEVLSVVGELTNIIAGKVKRDTEYLQYDFKLAQPEVVHGKDRPLKILGNSNLTSLPFHTNVGSFVVELNVESATSKKRKNRKAAHHTS